MDAALKTSLWQQFGAAIDTLGAAIRGCPDELWHAALWDTAPERPEYAQYWYLAYHTLFWLDLYLSGSREGFAPPAPFTLDELDPAGLLPERPYSPDELLAYLDHGRARCRATIESLTDETAARLCKFGWGELSFVELLLYTMRHTQEHAAQLGLFLGQNGIPAPGWVGRAKSSTLSPLEAILPLKTAYQDFVRLILSLTDRQFLTPLDGWAPRDVVAHLIGWNSLMIEASRSILDGKTPAYYTDAPNDYSQINAGFTGKYSSQSRPALLAELETSLESLAAFALSLPDEELTADHGVRHYRGGPASVSQVLASLAGDYAYHTRQIFQLIESQPPS